MKKVLFMVATFMLGLFMVNAQDAAEQSSLEGFEAHIGAVFPNGNFGDEKKGGAATGLNLGLKYYHPLKTPGLSLFLGLDAFYNGLQGDIKDDIEDYYGNDVDITHSAYLNIPIMAGVNYSYPLNEKTKVFGEFGLGLNYSKITDFKAEEDDDYYKESFDASTQLAYTIGGGLFFNDKYSIGLKYNNLGKHKYKVKWEEEIQGYKDKNSYKTSALSITNIAIVFGIRF